MPSDAILVPSWAAPAGAVVSALIAAFVGGFVAHLLTQLRERQRMRDEATLGHRRQQIEELYGPLYGIITECVTIYGVACRILTTIEDPDNPATNFRRVRIQEFPDDELPKWRFFMEQYFIPLNRKAVELLQDKAQLLETPHGNLETIDQFLRHAVAFESIHRMFQMKGIQTNKDVTGIGWPRKLHKEVGETLQRLRDENARFMHKLSSVPR